MRLIKPFTITTTTPSSMPPAKSAETIVSTSSRSSRSRATLKTVSLKEESDSEFEFEFDNEVDSKPQVRTKRKVNPDSDYDSVPEEKPTAKKPKATPSKAATSKPAASKPPPKPRAPRKKATASTKMAAPLATRALGSKMLFGAHVSMVKGVQNAITNSFNIGGNSLALFLKNQRRWTGPALAASDIAAFVKNCKTHNYDPRTQVLPHGSYLINLAQFDETKHKQAYDCFLDDLKRCEMLGIGSYNFHPGSTLGKPRNEALGRISEALNRAHKETKFVKTVVENMVGAGNVVGSSFEDLRDIIAGVEDKKRVGICLDTCHMFAAGHDIRTAEAYKKTMNSFDKIVGREYLCAIHLNDSKGPFQSKKDLHENIGMGHIGLEGFRVLVNDKRLEGLPIVLETPSNEDPRVWADEIKLLESLVGMTGEEEKFIAKSKELQEKGRAERERVNEVVERMKTKKTLTKKGKKEESQSEDEANDSCCSHD